MNAPNFTSILSAAPTEVNRPKALPVGSYITVLQGLPRQDLSTQKKTPFYEFTHKLLSAGDDVDQQALEEALTSPDGNMRNLQDVTMKQSFYLTENAVWRLDEFFEHCGFELDGSQSRQAMAEATPGMQVGIYIRHVPTQDGQSTRAEIGKTFAVE